MTRLLIIFARNPELGKTKTRLAKTLGDETALAIYYKLINKVQEVTADLPIDKAVYYSSFIDKEDSWDNNKYQKYLQKGATLGEKMYYAIEESITNGYQQVVLIGTDIYTLSAEIIMKSFDLLNVNDTVLGPAEDGGYYLIGMKRPEPSIFGLKEWSHSEVFSQTVELIKNQGMSYGTTQALSDIDEPNDLKGTDLEALI
ncbi:TIGR04282 family arsenosugar biosynthesis glycosyltransferase [Fulvivirga lutimaris]|uniref:TIGR04282 family arsenosugar biosynthesis glycosyltransferase n=1 Tax=Fulvivirga lutimaris TaxID=1819566 RepID=UPI0012BD81D2|nr:TIGR04282 family arsenosugar biosynthesis glycosyltransferase [Fulvivirga lutimaris]MTI39960.1 glycosyltransferase [Fulvivirga lutimaris]